MPAKVKAAVEILVTLTGAPDYPKIASQVGYRHAHELLTHLKPQSTRYLHDRKRQVLEGFNAANLEALRRVRDEGANTIVIDAR